MDKITSLGVTKCFAVACTGTFTGASIYLNVVSIPSIMTVKDTSAVLQYWRTTFLRASKMQVSLAILGSASSGVVYYYSDSEYRWLWLLGSGLIATIFPYTKIVMLGDINKLLKDNVMTENGESWVRQKISLWNKRSMFRSAVSDIAFNVMLLGMYLTC